MTAPNPVDQLVEPVATEPFDDLSAQISNVASEFSVTHDVAALFGYLFDWNPIEEAAKWFAGDWHAVSTAASALRHLGDYDRDFGAAVNSASSSALNTWRGNAASEAKGYFDGLAQAVSGQTGTLDAAAQNFEMMAAGVKSHAATAANLLEWLVDTIIQLTLEVAGGVVTAETGVGLLVAGEAAYNTVRRAYEVFKQLMDILGASSALLSAATGEIIGELGALRAVQQHPLPGSAYDHPLALR